MGNRIDILIRARDAASRVLARVKRSIGGVTDRLATISPAAAQAQTALSGVGLAAGPILAVVAALAAVAGAVVAVKKATDAVKGLAEQSERLTNLSQGLGFTRERMSELIGVAGDFGVTTRKAINAQRQFADRIGRGSEAFKVLGITTKDVDKAFFQFIDTLSTFRDDANKTAFITEAFGTTAGPELAAAFVRSEKEVKAHITTLREFGAVLTETDHQALAPSTQAVRDFDTAMDGAKNRITIALAPAVEALLTFLVTLAEGFNKLTQTATNFIVPLTHIVKFMANMPGVAGAAGKSWLVALESGEAAATRMREELEKTADTRPSAPVFSPLAKGPVEKAKKEAAKAVDAVEALAARAMRAFDALPEAAGMAASDASSAFIAGIRPLTEAADAVNERLATVFDVTQPELQLKVKVPTSEEMHEAFKAQVGQMEPVEVPVAQFDEAGAALERMGERAERARLIIRDVMEESADMSLAVADAAVTAVGALDQSLRALFTDVMFNSRNAAETMRNVFKQAIADIAASMVRAGILKLIGFIVGGAIGGPTGAAIGGGIAAGGGQGITAAKPISEAGEAMTRAANSIERASQRPAVAAERPQMQTPEAPDATQSGAFTSMLDGLRSALRKQGDDIARLREFLQNNAQAAYQAGLTQQDIHGYGTLLPPDVLPAHIQGTQGRVRGVLPRSVVVHEQTHITAIDTKDVRQQTTARDGSFFRVQKRERELSEGF